MKSLDQLQKEVGDWQQKTFPSNTVNSVLTHLKKEVAELQESHSPDEAADCIILLIRYARLRGVSLENEVEKKMEINYKRKWGSPDREGVIEHIK